MPSKISWWRTNFGVEEADRIAASIAQEHISQGPETAEFERRLAALLGVPHVVATTSGSTALLMSLIAAGVGPGDEVIVPNRGWIAAAHAVRLLGAKVVLADVQAGTPLLDVDDAAGRVTPKTRVIVPVHLNGRSVDMDAVNRLAAERGLIVIEDAAQALCSRNALGPLGGQSFAGCFSFSVAKIISTGQGGFIATRDAATYRRLSLMRTHGVADVVNAEWTEFGFNFRFTDILASIGLVQLGRLAGRIEQVKTIHAQYEAGLRGVESVKLISVNVAAGEIPIYIEVLCPARAALIAFLADRGIETRPFHPDLNLARYLDNPGVFPHSAVFATQGLVLPSGPGQTAGNVQRVLDEVRRFDAKRP
ncbi:MAG: DegT/DnrJ/EryC1/StrS family aminotransferase [Acidobacteriia bacterium]|nr:DegT/DnrJ/EryC1/StrS family aminotransferase [Terriglobia bacterium]